MIARVRRRTKRELFNCLFLCYFFFLFRHFFSSLFLFFRLRRIFHDDRSRRMTEQTVAGGRAGRNRCRAIPRTRTSYLYIFSTTPIIIVIITIITRDNIVFSRAVHNAPDSSRYRLCRRHNRGHYCFVREISDGKTGGSPLTNCRSSSTRLLLLLRRPHPSFARPLVFRRRVNVLVPRGRSSFGRRHTRPLHAVSKAESPQESDVWVRGRREGAIE